ncbi:MULTISPECIES: PDR/VanB family oxidoreductase [Burkholderia cepacia complex]|uniref:PDR/VanB family oxidoreductase n=1 Tax=Burkholderia cepacia complex TaxID=87882 RepID=UPI000CFEDA9D|nr:MULTISPECIES: PDR/VanB family oxidoreductase [Burkholderia cepacia complex]MBU9206003.1 PDR/VanB family oxidoreductase [Burkholderia multivorans]MBU9486671.1 PDR/VanB family oxidoreductase [Burkholderia multivorans]MBU9492781.1 PDR/VanB family oxidoreductase [Burkholderia multivorans]MBU9522449.1 PDR/VanB family oxidoreductase [Burkholderia multivorans]MBU9558784.1 PDR/VanB family oxidoreductase [Burkholderia multivorans]
MTTPQEDGFLRLKIASKEKIARDIWRFELADPQRALLPPFEAGAHLTVVVPNGARRSYSLCNDSQERDRYVIAVKRDNQGRGGSISFVDDTAEGDVVDVSLPRNAFPLDEGATSFILVAGGIGITPILSMARQLRAEGLRPFKLYYLARDPEGTAFLDELGSDDWRSDVKIHHDHGDPSKAFDFWPVFERPKSGAHVYCCGPQALMDTVRDMTGHWPSGTVHFESFGAGHANAHENTPFTVRLARSGTSFDVPANRSILDVLRDANVRVPSSCESGTCGSCRTGLCSGDADHRDLVLRDDEKASQIIVCVSRAKSAELVLDL